jgi:hypothetical protein
MARPAAEKKAPKAKKLKNMRTAEMLRAMKTNQEIIDFYRYVAENELREEALGLLKTFNKSNSNKKAKILQ